MLLMRFSLRIDDRFDNLQKTMNAAPQEEGQCAAMPETAD